MKFSILAIIIFAFSSCGKYYRLSSYLNNNALAPSREIKIDSSYKYYIRQLYREKQNGLKGTKTFINKSDKDSLLEVEYLFVSKDKGNVIYISTVPDKYQKYYSDTTQYKGENYINVYDFKKMCFGKFIESKHNGLASIVFISKNEKDQDVWNVEDQIRDSRHYISVNTIEEDIKNEFVDLVPVSKALEEDISFKKLSPFSFIFFRNDKKISLCTNSSDNIIYIDKENKKYQAYFKFERLINGNSNIVYFDDKRIQYSPEPLVKY